MSQEIQNSIVTAIANQLQKNSKFYAGFWFTLSQADNILTIPYHLYYGDELVGPDPQSSSPGLMRPKVVRVRDK